MFLSVYLIGADSHVLFIIKSICIMEKIPILAQIGLDKQCKEEQSDQGPHYLQLSLHQMEVHVTHQT